MERSGITNVSWYSVDMVESFSMRPQAFGLDISDLSIKIIDLTNHTPLLSLYGNKKETRISVYGELRIKQGIVEKGEIKKQADLQEGIRRAVSSLSGTALNKRHVVASLPEERAFVQVIQLPRMSKQEAMSAVPFEAENYIPYALDSVYIDFEILPTLPNADHIDVLLCALPREIVDPYVEAIRGAGFTPLALEIESLSFSRALMRGSVSPVPVLIMDLGETRTGIAVFSDSSLRFTSSVPVSGAELTEAIMRSLGVEQSQAEALKLSHGLSRASGEDSGVLQALIPPMTNLVEQTKKYMNFYESHEEHRHVSLKKETKIGKVILCGGGASMKGIIPFLAKELSIEVEKGNPWVNTPLFRGTLPPLALPDALRYTTAIGLALRGNTYD
ncbi:MAG: type IV pilus assembly protein PilM [bacterium]|nr:type IV pilus assembly protein PilM [bacterium]